LLLQSNGTLLCGTLFIAFVFTLFIAFTIKSVPWQTAAGHCLLLLQSKVYHGTLFVVHFSLLLQAKSEKTKTKTKIFMSEKKNLP